MNLKEKFAPALKAIECRKPTIMLVSGMAAFGIAAYANWRAGRKHDSVIEQNKSELEAIRAKRPETTIDEETGREVEVKTDISKSETPYTMTDYRKDLALSYGKAALRLGKTYGPAVVAEVAGYAFTFKSFGILSRRAANSLAACLVAERGYSEYRKRVIDALGAEADREFRLGVKEMEIDIPELDKNGVPKLDKEGKPKTKKKKIQYMDGQMPRQASMYARMWDKNSTPYYETMKDVDENGDMVDTGRGDNYYNYPWLIKMQATFNDKLKAKKGNYVWLNDVYKALGYPETAASRNVGWYYDPDRTDGKDNFIDFGILPLKNESAYDHKRKTDFIDGTEDTILLDFNVNGDITHLVFPELQREGV